MSFKSSQLIITGLAGVATAIGVACATMNAPSSEINSAPSPNSTQPSPRPATSPITKPASSSSTIPSPVASPPPANIPSPIASPPPVNIPSPVASTPQPSPSSVAQVSPSPAKPEPTAIAVSPPESGCKISMALIVDPNPPLNVRSSPQITESNIVGQLQNNSFVSVAKEQDGWLQITDPVPGWIAKNRTKSSCPLVKERINFLPGGNEAIITGQIIGGGSHTYLIKAAKNQTMTVTNHKKVFPVVLAPDGKILAIDANGNGNKTQWTGQVPANGDYTFQLDSNYKGFEYEFSVQLK